MRTVLLSLLYIFTACHSRPSGITTQPPNISDSLQTAIKRGTDLSAPAILSSGIPGHLQIVLAGLEQDTLSARSAAVGQYSVAVINWPQGKLAVCSDPDGHSFILQKSGKQWHLADTLNMTQIWQIDTIDINGDGYTDILLNDFPNVHGNIYCIPLLCDARGTFTLREDCGLVNLRYDHRTRIIRSFTIGGVFTTTYKEEYRWSNDSLHLIRGVDLTPDTDTRHEMYDAHFYHKKNGEKVIDKHLRGAKVNQVYDQAFWDIAE